MPQFPFLPYLTFCRLRVTFEALETLVLTEYPGSALRSCMMEAMLATACAKKQKKTCIDDCELRYTCAWSVIFNSYSQPDHPHNGNFSRTPPPYMIEPTTGNQMQFNKGENFGFYITIIGSAIKHLPQVLKAFEGMGKVGIGRGRGKFTPVRLESLRADMEYEPMSYFGKPEELTLSKLKIPQVDNRLKLLFQVGFHTRVNSTKILDKAPTFDLLVHRLINRLSLLAHFHCDAAWYDTPKNPPTTNIALIYERTEMDNHQRKTKSMEEPMKFNGPIGTAIYEGNNLNDWMPLIILGSWLHVGSTTTMGSGIYTLVTD